MFFKLFNGKHLIFGYRFIPSIFIVVYNNVFVLNSTSVKFCNYCPPIKCCYSIYKIYGYIQVVLRKKEANQFSQTLSTPKSHVFCDNRNDIRLFHPVFNTIRTWPVFVIYKSIHKVLSVSLMK